MKVVASVVCVIVLAGTAWGQGASPLAGPKVETPAKKATLVERDMQGVMRPLETAPEEAALALLTLSETEKAAVDRLLRARAEILDGVIRENLVLLLRVQGLSGEGAAKEDAQAALKELTRLLAPLRQRGPARNEISGVLMAENAKAFGGMLDEYWQAMIDDAVAKERETNPKAAVAGVAVRERLKAFGQEIRRSYDRQIAAGQARLEETIALLGLTPEQDGKIRNMVTDYFQKTAGNPTATQRREFFGRLMKELTPEQRVTIMKELYSPPKATPMKDDAPMSEPAPK